MSYAREYSITYGSTTVGGSSATNLLTNVHIVRQGFLVAEVRFTFEVVATTATLFASACAAAERAFREPDQNLRVRLGASTLLDLSQDANTGLDAMPTIEKVEEPDGGRARRYVVRIEVGRPGGRAGVAGLRRTTVNLSFSPARRKTVVVEGEFSAAGNEGARARYDAAVEALAQAALTDIGGTFELSDEAAVNTTNDKSLLFRRVYEEVIYTEGGQGLDDAAIVRQKFTISDEQANAAWMHADARPLAFTTVRWDAWIDRDETQDLPGKWDEVKDWAIEQAIDVAAGGIAVVTMIRPEFDYTENRITASIVVASNTREKLSYNLVIRDETDPGKVLVPAWIEGSQLYYYQYDGPAVAQRVVEEEYVAMKNVSRDEAEAAHEVNCDAAKGSFPSLRDVSGNKSGLEWVSLPTQIEVEDVSIGVDHETRGTRVRARSVFQAIKRVSEYST